jgi:hypothetical protein
LSISYLKIHTVTFGLWDDAGTSYLHFMGRSARRRGSCETWLFWFKELPIYGFHLLLHYTLKMIAPASTFKPTRCPDLHYESNFTQLINLDMSSVFMHRTQIQSTIFNSLVSTNILSWILLYNHFARTTQKTQPPHCWEGVFTAPLHSNGSYSFVACVFVAAGMCLLSRFLSTNVYSDFAIPALGRHVTAPSNISFHPQARIGPPETTEFVDTIWYL